MEEEGIISEPHVLAVRPRSWRSLATLSARRAMARLLRAVAAGEFWHLDREREAAACCVFRIDISLLRDSCVTFSPGWASVEGRATDSAMTAARTWLLK